MASEQHSTPLTVLFFSRNDTDKAVELIRDMASFADEIVVCDSSDDEQKKVLTDFKHKTKLSTLKIYNVPALGYPEPVQAYAFLKCSNEWILRLDTDERISDGLKRDIKKVIASGSDGFSLRRYEEATFEDRGKVFTWQTRIFKKSKTHYTGILHEQPQVDGTLDKLDADDYYMLHVTTLMSHGKPTSAGYSAIHRIDKRLSYALYNKKMLDYLAKFLITDPKKASRTVLGRLLIGWMSFYEAVLFRGKDSEISNFDYFMYAWSTSVGFFLINRDFKHLHHSFEGAFNTVRDIKRWRMEPDGKICFEISKIINNLGIIKFLGLDDPQVVDNITKRYHGEPQGIQLLISLLKERYSNNKHNVDS